MNIILASGSPRRTQLLSQVGIEHMVNPSECEEVITTTIPEKVVMELAKQKAKSVFDEQIKSNQYRRVSNVEDSINGNDCEDILVLGADTVVAQSGRIFGKPKDEKDAFDMIKSLQGKTHQVYTGVALVGIINGQKIENVFFESSNVNVYSMSEGEILDYVRSGESMDKAGAYGIQGLFAAYVKGIEGDYNNIVGLPVGRVYQEIKICSDYALRNLKEH